MIEHFLRHYVTNTVQEYLQDILKDYVQEEMVKSIKQMVVLDPSKQYLVFVDTDQEARELVEAITKYLDQSQMAHLAILSGTNPKFLEIEPKKA